MRKKMFLLVLIIPVILTSCATAEPKPRLVRIIYSDRTRMIHGIDCPGNPDTCENITLQFEYWRLPRPTVKAKVKK